MLSFLIELINLVKKFKISKTLNRLQNNLTNIIKYIKDSKIVRIYSDKAGNLYSFPIEMYENFIENELHSKYEIVADSELEIMNNKHYDLIDKLKLIDRTEPYKPRTPHFIFKGHKEKFSTFELLPKS